MQDVLLCVNLGSPSSHNVSDVRRYLDDFLMDEYVIDIPWFFRFLLVKMIVVPFRSSKTALAYQDIWTKEGSPLIIHTQRMIDKLSKQCSFPVFLAMTYGKNNILNKLKKIQKMFHGQSIRLHVFPLFPQYAMSTTGAVMNKVFVFMKKLSFSTPVHLLPPFFGHKLYIESLFQLLSFHNFNMDDYEHILFSFHGLPLRHLFKTDPSKNHCLKVKNCCEQEHLAHKTCYKAQALQTAKLLALKLDLPASKWTLCFQSRFGRAKWLEPDLLVVLKDLIEANKKKIFIISPSFVADCLETLEEINIRTKEFFFGLGGKKLELLPCLNEHSFWIRSLKIILEEHLAFFV